MGRFIGTIRNIFKTPKIQVMGALAHPHRLKTQVMAGIAGGLFLSAGIMIQVTAQPTVGVIPAPTILKPNYGETIRADEFVLAGVTVNGSQVGVYINNKARGTARVKNHPSGTASFAWVPESPLENGSYKIWVEARTPDGNGISKPSAIAQYTIITPYPRPTVLQPVVNDETVYMRPWLVGLAQSGDMVEVELDGEVIGKAQVSEDESGVGSFQILSSKDLSLGWHSVRARSVDGVSRTSSWSGAYVFAISNGKAPSKVAEQLVSQTKIGEGTGIAAPTILEPKQGDVVTAGNWHIAGVVHNDLKVQLFNKENLIGEVEPKAHKSGVTSFAFDPKDNLTHGVFTLSARASDASGNYSAVSDSISIIIKPNIAQLTVITPQGATLWPKKPVVEIGEGMKVVRADAQKQKSGITNQEEESSAQGESTTGGEISKLVIKDEEIVGAENFQPEEVIDIQEAEGLVPEITGPQFEDTFTAGQLDQLLEGIEVVTTEEPGEEPQIIVSDTDSINEIVADKPTGAGTVDIYEEEEIKTIEESVSKESDSAGATTNKSTDMSEDEETKDGVFAGIKDFSKNRLFGGKYRPEALALIAAGVILILGIVITMIRDRKKLVEKKVLDFTDSKKTTTFQTGEEPEAQYKNIHSFEAPPPPPTPPGFS